MTAQPPQAEGAAVARSYGDAEAWRDREGWRLGSACSGGFYGAEVSTTTACSHA